jgi:hypothetical protein
MVDWSLCCSLDQPFRLGSRLGFPICAHVLTKLENEPLQHKRTHRQVFNHEPFGYRRDGETLVPIADEQATIGRIRALRSAGGTLDAIAGTLNSEAIPTKRGCKWNARTVLNVVNSDLFEAA